MENIVGEIFYLCPQAQERINKIIVSDLIKYNKEILDLHKKSKDFWGISNL